MNVADSNEMARHFKASGLVETDDPDEASVILVNTCTVRQHAEDRAFSEIGRLKRWKAKRPGPKVVVTGCAAERTKEYLEDRFPFRRSRRRSQIHRGLRTDRGRVCSIVARPTKNSITPFPQSTTRSPHLSPSCVAATIPARIASFLMFAAARSTIRWSRFLARSAIACVKARAKSRCSDRR